MSTHLHTLTNTHTLNNSTSVFVCLWDSIRYRPFLIQKTSPILENKALCFSVVTGHAIGRKYFDSNTFIKQAFKKQNNSRFFKQNISVDFSLSFGPMILYIILYQNKNHMKMGTKRRTKGKNKKQNIKGWLQLSTLSLLLTQDQIDDLLHNIQWWQRLQYLWWFILFYFSQEPWIYQYPSPTSHSFGPILQTSPVHFKTKTQW